MGTFDVRFKFVYMSLVAQMSFMHWTNCRAVLKQSLSTRHSARLSLYVYDVEIWNGTAKIYNSMFQP